MERKITVLFVVLMLALTAVACQNTPAAPAPTATTAAAPTEAPPTAEPPTQTPPPAPTEAPATAEPTAAPTVAPPEFAFCSMVDPTLINLNTEGLEAGWQADCVPATPYAADGPMLTGLPEHIEITFGETFPANHEPGDPIIYVIPAEAYRAQWDAAGNPVVGEQLDALRGWVDRRPVAVRTSNMPVLPMEEAPATNDLAVQGRYLDLGSWSGIRFVGRHSQDASPITNQGLRYIFQGFAGENDEYLVAFFYPVTTPHLPPTAEEVTAAEMDLLASDPAGYFEEHAAALNALTAADWQPDLEVLDKVVSSLQYGGEEIAEEGETIEGETGESLPSSYAVVSGPAGVNIRTGPSTAFPSVGVAAHGTRLEIVGRSQDGQWWVTPIVTAPQGRGWVSAGFVDATINDAIPVIVAPPLPTPVPVPPTATPQPANPVLNFWVDRSTINSGECTTLRWSVANIRAVWVYPVGEDFRNFPATGDGSRSVCPQQTTTYEMRVELVDGSIVTRQVTVNVLPSNLLAGMNFALASFGNGQSVLPGAPPTLRFGAGNSLSGFGGCNNFTGEYSTLGQSGVSIRVGARGMMSCGLELDAQENLFIEMLNRVASWEHSGFQTIFRDGAGTPLLTFVRQ